MAHDVFISYSQKDKATADAVCRALEQNSVRVWIAPRDIPPGAKWAESIPAAIERASAFVLIFSSSANTSEYISRELDHAVTKRKPIIPVRLENIQPSGSVGFYVATSQWLDAFPPPIEPHLANLIKTTRRSLGVRAPSAKVVVAPSSKARSPESARPAISTLLTATNSEAPTREFPTAGHWLAGIAGFVAVAAFGVFLVLTSGGDDPAARPVPPSPNRVTQVNSQGGDKDCAASNWACSEDAEIEDSSLPGMDEVNGMPRVLSASALMIRSRRVELANIGMATPDSAKKLNDWLALNGNSVRCRPAPRFRGKYFCDVGPTHIDLSAHILSQNWAKPLESGAPR
ncbi:MAG: toll/interleukin-1 receptor domain-containing protein [Methylocystis sp.]